MATRLITSAVGLAVLFAVVLLSNTIVLPAALGLVTAIILFELTRAVGGEKFRLALAGVLVCGFFGPIETYWRVSGVSVILPDWANTVISYAVSLLVPLCLLCLFLEFLWHHGSFRVEQLGFMTAAMLLVRWSLSYLVNLRFLSLRHGIFYMILALGGAWIADSGAYFCGVALGRHKLCPNISPKKTVEGFVGGLVSNTIIFMLIFWIYALVQQVPFGVPGVLRSGLLGLVCAGISVVGDLTASVIKREKGIKDYGHLMPGHGGLMDRFDSVLFVVPAFHLIITMFPIF